MAHAYAYAYAYVASENQALKVRLHATIVGYDSHSASEHA